MPNKIFTLVKEDCLALRNADAVFFSIKKNERKAYVHCLKYDLSDYKKEKPNTWSFDIDAEICFLRPDLVRPASASIGLNNTNLDWEWQTCAAFLREFDVIELLVQVDFATTPDLLELGFHADLITLVIYRKPDLQFRFLIGVCIAKTSPQRIIKYED